MNFLQPGQQIESKVVAITDDAVFLDLNAKSEGVLDKAELTDENGNVSVKENDVLKVFFVGTKNGEMVFTTKIAGDKADKAMLENAWQNNIPVEGKVEKEVKGGFEVRIGTSRAFCPFSQMGFKQKEETNFYLGKTFEFLITEFKKDGKDILVSNRKIAEAEYEKNFDKFKDEITVGKVVGATVVSLQKFGAFVELDGAQIDFAVLLPISEISRNRIENINDALSIGQKIKVKVIKTDWQNEKVSVSLKALEKNPWDNVAENFPVGTKIDGTISRVVDFGVFVNVADGIDGLVHISQLGVDRNTNIRKKFNKGDKMSVVVKDVDAKNERLSLDVASSIEQDETTSQYLNNQNDDGTTYNPFATLLKNKSAL